MMPGTPEYEKLVAGIEAFNKKSLSRVMNTTGPLPPKLPPVPPRPKLSPTVAMVVAATDLIRFYAQKSVTDVRALDAKVASLEAALSEYRSSLSAK